MRLRAIAGVGVVLCTAITTLSIYLGIAEHVYTRPPVYHAVLAYDQKGQPKWLCLTTTTAVVHSTDQVSCTAPTRHQ